MLSFLLATAILMTFFVILNIIHLYIQVDDPCICGLIITCILIGYIFWVVAGFAVINANVDVTIITKQIEKEERNAEMDK